MICKLLPVSYPSLPSRDVQMTLPQVSVVNNRTSERILKKKILKEKNLNYYPRRPLLQPAGCLPETHGSQSLEPQMPVRITTGNERLSGNAFSFLGLAADGCQARVRTS